MTYNGDYVTEGKNFKTIDSAWERANDMGSRWFFYPFCFVTSASGLTISEAPNYLNDLFKGMRVASVVKLFERMSKKPEAQKMGVEEFALFVYNNA
jgi:hypothetical protein